MKRPILYILFAFIIFSCNDEPKPAEVSSSPKEINNTNSTPNISPDANNSAERGTTPIDDQTHIEAAVMAKEFVVKKLNTSPAPKFDDQGLEWLKLKHNIYQISSTAIVSNGDSAKQTYNWIVKLKYKSGDWADIKNWNLIDIKISRKN